MRVCMCACVYVCMHVLTQVNVWPALMSPNRRRNIGEVACCRGWRCVYFLKTYVMLILCDANPLTIKTAYVMLILSQLRQPM